MSAIPEDFIQTTNLLSDDVTRPFPGSKRVYLQGSRPDIQVPIREISQMDTETMNGVEKNPPIPVYDTSGPYTDPKIEIDLLKGLVVWIKSSGIALINLSFLILLWLELLLLSK